MTRRRNVLAAGAALVAASMLAGGCGGDTKPPPNLPLACETLKCTCFDPDSPFWRKTKEVPVEWRSNGEAFCPAGFELRLAGK